MEEAAGLGQDLDLVTVSGDAETVEGADGRGGLARRGAERGEVVTPEQGLGGGVHCVGVERLGDVPDTACEEGRTAGAVEDAIAVGPAIGAEAGAPALRYRRRLQDDDRMGLHVVGQGGLDGFRGEAVREIDMGDLARGVDAQEVGSSGDDTGDGLAGVEAGGGRLQHLLHGKPGDLALPADERGADILDQQSPAGH